MKDKVHDNLEHNFDNTTYLTLNYKQIFIL